MKSVTCDWGQSLYLHPPQTWEDRDHTKLGHGYEFYHYIIIYNSELGQLKEASLDSFLPSRLRTMPKPGIHFNIQSIRRCARPPRNPKCATNTFTRSIFHKKKNSPQQTFIIWLGSLKKKAQMIVKYRDWRENLVILFIFRPQNHEWVSVQLG